MSLNTSSSLNILDSLFEEKLIQDLELDPVDEINRRGQISRIKRSSKNKRINSVKDFKSAYSSPLSSNDTLLDFTTQN